MNTKQTFTTSMSGSCIKLAWTAPVTVAAIKIKAAQLPSSLELGIGLISHVFYQLVEYYLGFFHLTITCAVWPHLQCALRVEAINALIQTLTFLLLFMLNAIRLLSYCFLFSTILFTMNIEVCPSDTSVLQKFDKDHCMHILKSSSA